MVDNVYSLAECFDSLSMEEKSEAIENVPCSLGVFPVPKIKNVKGLDTIKFKNIKNYGEKKNYTGVVLKYDNKNKIWHLNASLKFTVNDITEKNYIPEPFDCIRASVKKGSLVKQIEPLKKSLLTGTVLRIPRNKNDWGSITGNIFYNAWNFPGQSLKKGDLLNISAVKTKFKWFLWRAISIEVLKKHHKSVSKNKTVKIPQTNSQWVLYKGVKPELENKQVRISSLLPEYPVPKNLKKKLNNKV